MIFDHQLPDQSPYSVVTVPALEDNYMYLIIDNKSKECAVVDAVNPTGAMKQASKLGCKITQVLTTHSHWDHDGGNEEIESKLKVPIVGGKGDNAKAVTREVSEGDVINVGEIQINVIETPFHTPGHVCYYIEGSGDGSFQGSVFTGDTLFIGGCGNLNAGNKHQLHEAFAKLGKLPVDTLVWVGHEYTVANFQYALSVEPENKELLAKYKWALRKKREGAPTVPSTIWEEHAVSPFMRAAFGASKEIADLSKEDSKTVEGRIEQILWTRLDKSSSRWKAKWAVVREAVATHKI